MQEHRYISATAQRKAKLYGSLACPNASRSSQHLFYITLLLLSEEKCAAKNELWNEIKTKHNQSAGCRPTCAWNCDIWCLHGHLMHVCFCGFLFLFLLSFLHEDSENVIFTQNQLFRGFPLTLVCRIIWKFEYTRYSQLKLIYSADPRWLFHSKIEYSLTPRF